MTDKLFCSRANELERLLYKNPVYNVGRCDPFELLTIGDHVRTGLRMGNPVIIDYRPSRYHRMPTLFTPMWGAIDNDMVLRGCEDQVMVTLMIDRRSAMFDLFDPEFKAEAQALGRLLFNDDNHSGATFSNLLMAVSRGRPRG